MPDPIPRPPADNDFLLGVLALHLDFIRPDVLVPALRAWLPRRDAPLGRALVDQGVLTREDRALLEALVGRHLERHGNDPDQSLASLRGAGPLPEELVRLARRDADASLTYVMADDAAGNTPVAPVGRPTSSGGRFRVLRPQAQGGLGVVSVALDTELNREVALKELRRRHADDPDCRACFLLEAEVTGHLEHPGVVPVYSLGAFPDGRPFYAMRFVRGDSLQEAVERFHKQDGPGRDPGERAVALRGLLGRFVGVCNAVAYAHSRGILHRDLKPRNIMLGPYGETLVVDWGSAKVTARPADGAGPGEWPRPGGGLDTAEGTGPVGTPAYMSPEQAGGWQVQLGPASDVYGLGATLYHLLAGRAPFHGDDVMEVLRRVQAGDFPPPRRMKPSVPPALEAVCLKAMALRPQDRYASATGLAGEVEHWLADEPVSAYREPRRARLARWARRHRAVVSTAAAVLLTAVVGLAAGLWAVWAEQARTAEARDRAEDNLALAEANFRLAKRAVDQCLLTAKEDPLFQQDELREVRRTLLAKALPFYEGFRVCRGDDPDITAGLADAYFNVAYITEEIGSKRDALRAYEKARAIYQRLVERRPDVAEYQRELAGTCHNLGLLQVALGRRAAARRSYERARDIGERLVARHPKAAAYRRYLAATYDSLGLLCSEEAKPAGALRSWQRARDLYRKLAADHPGVSQYRVRLAHVYSNLGVLHGERGRPAERLASYAMAIALLEPLVRRQPPAVAARHPLRQCYLKRAEVLAQRGRHAEAARDWGRAAELDAGPEALHFRVQRALELALAKDHARATAEAEDLARAPQLPGNVLYDLACVFSLSSAAVRADAQLPAAEQNKRAETSAARAIALLGRARVAGFFEEAEMVRNLKKDPDLDPLRARADFKKLLADLENEAKAGRK
jgi:serine/threonine-protein kinase